MDTTVYSLSDLNKLVSVVFETMHPPSLQLLRALRSMIPGSVPRTLNFRSSTASMRPQLSHCQRTLFFSTSSGRFEPPPPSHPPKSKDRGPPSTEKTQTDFSSLNVLGNTPPPTTSIDACLTDGFHLDNGLKVSDGKGLLLVSGEAFEWAPWEAGLGSGGMTEATQKRERTAEGAKAGITSSQDPNEMPSSTSGVTTSQPSKGRQSMKNAKGQWEVQPGAWSVLELVWPKPGASLPDRYGDSRRDINID